MQPFSALAQAGEISIAWDICANSIQALELVLLLRQMEKTDYYHLFSLSNFGAGSMVIRFSFILFVLYTNDSLHAVFKMTLKFSEMPALESRYCKSLPGLHTDNS